MTRRKKRRTEIARDQDAAAMHVKAEHNATMGRLSVLPHLRHAAVSRKFANPLVGDRESEWSDTIATYADETNAAADGDLRQVSRMLMAQALTLDAVFTQMTDRAANNMAQYPDATDRYLRLALKAQTNSRATMEALARLHQPREQTVKHVHVNQGGQAIVADRVTYGQGASNGYSVEQSHAQGSCRAALSGPHAEGDGVPIAGGEGQETLQDAWRDEPRRSVGK